MKNIISIKKIKADAEEVFRLGGFYCSEAVVSSIRKNIDPDMPLSLVAAASGFPVGLGRSRCMCGAVSGALIVLGYFFGKDSKNPDENKLNGLIKELTDSFRHNHKGVLCCHVHVKGMDMASGEHKKQCIAFTGEMAALVAKLIARELKINLKGTKNGF